MYNLIMKNRLTAEETAQKHYEKMTQTPVVKLIVQLGLPTTLSMLITNIYNMADTYFVGTLGQSEQGAIGIVFTLQAIIQAVAFTLGHGSGTYVAKELADKNTQKATTYVSSAFFLGRAFGIVFGVFGLIFLQPFMRLLGSTETILPHACDYGMWALISCPFLICSLVLNNNLRYEGKAFFSMIGLVSGGVLNIALDYVFVVICNMGVFGAGMATAISQVVSFGLLLFFYMKMAQSTISVKAVSKDVKQYLAIFRTGAPSFVRQGMNAISGGVLNHLARYYGGLVDAADATIDAMSIVNRVSSLVFCVGLGICQGLQPVASYNYQLKLYSRVKKALGATCIICFAIILMLAIPVWIFAEPIAKFIQNEQSTVDIATPALRYAMVGLIFMPLFSPLNMMYQSIRKAEAATFLALLRNGIVFIPIIFALASMLQITGIQLAQPASDVITGLISIPFLITFFTKTPKDASDEVASRN